MTAIQMEALDFRYLLLEYYKKLDINENELSVLLMIDHLRSQKNIFITPDLLSLKMNLTTDQLDEILGGLKGIATSEDGSVDAGLKTAANVMYSKIMKSIIEALGEPTELISSIDSTKAKLAEQVKITQDKTNTPEVIEQAEAKRKEFLSILAQ